MTGSEGERALVVIPCLNEAAHLRDLIERLLDDPAWADPLLVVADGGSTDASRSIVAEVAASDPRVRLMVNPARLQSAGVNLAARQFGEGRRWLVRCDAHAGYPKGYVSALLSEAWRTGADAVAVPMRTVGVTAFERAAAMAQNSVLGTGGSAHRVGAPGHWVDHGHHAVIALDRFLAVGGYDESFSHNEDAEFDARLRRSGGKIWLTDQTAITYKPRSEARALARQYYMYGRGRARNLLKHRERPRLRQVLPLAVAPACLGFALSILAPSWFAGPLFAWPAYLWAAACMSCGAWLALKARDPIGLLAAPVAMLAHAAWSFGFWRQALGQGLSSLSRPGERAPQAQAVRP